MNSIEIKSKSEKETQQIGSLFSQNLKGNELILLFGNIGAGKTTFTQGLLRGLGYEGWGRSPTFVLINEYNLKHKVEHMDFYRLNKTSELIELGLEEYLDSDSVKIIEWPELSTPLLPHNSIDISISQKSNSERLLKINVKNIQNSYLLKSLKS
tara:strand:+ start:757 stop:1218 length:462 start_codon:yes stop_codon:yes gene_type:complete